MILQFSMPMPDCAPCCVRCPDVEAIDAVISGAVTGCGCVFPSGIFQQYVSHTGVTGAFTATRISPGLWRVVVGTWTRQLSSGGADCDGDTRTDDVLLEITCTPDDPPNPTTNLNVRLIVDAPFMVPFFAEPLFADAFDVALPNEVACSANVRTWYLDGAITLSLP